MAKTLGCADIGYDCAFRITSEDGDESLMTETAATHAQAHHPELGSDAPKLRDNLRGHIRDLLAQSGYTREDEVV